MTLTIQALTVDQMEQDPALGALVAAYAEESANPAFGPANPQASMYRQLEAAGLYHLLGAYVGDDLVGFIAVLITVLPHFGQVAATSESWFVDPDRRDTGAGLALLRAAETLAETRGAVALMVSAPHGGKLAQVMPHIAGGYSHTNDVFTRRLSCSVH